MSMWKWMETAVWKASLALALLVVGMAVVDGQAAEPAPANTVKARYMATAAPLPKSPVLDGVISPGEWDGCIRTPAFAQAPNHGRLLPRKGTTRFGFHGDRLYIAVVSDYPPTGKDHSNGTDRDKDYVWDEGIEIWIDPNRPNRVDGKGEQRFYQMNANAAGGIYDISFDPINGADTGWNGNWEYASKLDHTKHAWTVELSLPFADLGWEPATVIGRTLGLLVSRNFKNPWEQSSWFPVVGAFVDWSRYAAIELTADEPVVELQSLGDNVHKAHLQLRARIYNPGPAREAKVRMELLSSTMPEAIDEKTIALPAKGFAEYVFEDSPNRLHEHAMHTLTLNVDTAEGRTLMRYGAEWTKAPEKLWHYHVGPNPSAALAFAYYPSYQFVRVQVDPRELDEELGKTCREAETVITTADGKTIVVRETIAWEKAPGLRELPVGDLAEGEYTLTVTVPGWKDPLVRSFKRVKFPFEGNTLGITDEVLPPFTPMQVKDSTVSVVLRDMEVDGLGLWRSVKAAGNVSAGGPEDLLAAPMALVADGVALKGKGRFVKTAPHMVVYEGGAEHPAVKVTTRCTTEMDGCMKVELTLEPVEAGGQKSEVGGQKSETLNSLYLDIPLRDALMPLWHVSTTGLRVNPAGAILAGEGLVWDASRTPDGNWFGDFLPYLWFGAEERGLAWFADNDAGWVHSLDAKGQPNKAGQELFRKDGVLTLRINLVQAPITIDTPRRIVFGLMASPAKPMPEDWRQRGFARSSTFNMGYASSSRFCGKTPWAQDFTIADWVYRQRTGKGGPSQEEKDAWIARVFPADMDANVKSNLVKLAVNSFLGQFKGQYYAKMYFDEFHTTSVYEPESHVFQSEWSGNWHRNLASVPTDRNNDGVNVMNIVRSHQDFACWYAAEWIKRGVGIYFDNSFPMRGYDTLTTSAYRLPNGRIQPSAGIWARRDYLRRIWTLHRLLGPKEAARVAMMIHMTNTHILPYMVWNDENLDLEWKDAGVPAQTKYGHAFLRAESLGRQTGNVPDAIAHAQRTAGVEPEIATRTRFGTLMVHEIRPTWTLNYRKLYDLVKAFGYGNDDCRIFNYWDAGAPVAIDDPECKWLLLEKDGERLLLLCTWNGEARDVKIALKTATPLQEASDAETPETTFAVEGNALTMPMASYGVRLLRLR